MDAQTLLGELIEDLEHALSVNQHAVDIDHILATLREIRDRLNLAKISPGS